MTAVSQPAFRLLQGGQSAAVIEWEAALEVRVADLIDDYLRQCPCSSPSVVGADLERWARLLREDALSRRDFVQDV